MVITEIMLYNCKKCFDEVMDMENTAKTADKRGYLETAFRLFHLEDRQSSVIPYHYHEFHKIVLFLSGEVQYLVEGRKYLLREGDLLLIPAYAIHQPVISEKQKYSRFIIWIRPETLEKWRITEGFRICREQNAYLMKRDRYDRSELMKILQKMEKTEKENDYGKEALLEALLIEGIFLLTKAVMKEEPNLREQEKMIDPKINEIIQYIDQNLENDLSVENLASRYYLSKSWLMHRFKEVTNCTVHQFILQKRLILASQNLLGGVPAERAAEKSGFTDYSTFLRAFRRTYGITPREYIRYHEESEFTRRPEFNE